MEVEFPFCSFSNFFCPSSFLAIFFLSVSQRYRFPGTRPWTLSFSLFLQHCHKVPIQLGERCITVEHYRDIGGVCSVWIYTAGSPAGVKSPWPPVELHISPQLKIYTVITAQAPPKALTQIRSLI